MHGTSFRARVVAAALLGLVLSAVATVSPATTITLSSDEQQMVSWVNQARASAGRVALKKSPGLTDISRTHSRAMRNKGYIFHTPPDQLRYELRNYRWSVAGENVGNGSTPKAVYDAFMASAGHRANILYGKYRWIGVGAVRTPGRVWYTITFLG